ncbi:MAG: inward rectifier potassium channel [Methylobacteriaceae bacterium]|nr:inward rectifier potassium channel [Methylobacteriaceae bacterium]
MNKPLSAKKRAGRKVRFGDRVVMTRGLVPNFWGDLYHTSLTISWVRFFAFAALAFLTINTVFAGLYFLGHEPIANARPGSFRDLFYFSIETLATVGYGDMHPQTDYAHLLATVEIFTGLSFLAIMTGLVFTRFSRPRARVLFADRALIAEHDGQRVWTVRIANVRLNAITDATARLWLARTQETRESGTFRSFVELPLLRNESPLFALSWSLFHVVDEKSPLHGQTLENLEAVEAAFVVSLRGHDESLAQNVTARRTYKLDDVRWNHRYDDILSLDESGKLTIDYNRFHQSKPIAPVA